MGRLKKGKFYNGFGSSEPNQQARLEDFEGLIYEVSNYLAYSSTKSSSCCTDKLDSMSSLLKVSIPKKV